MDARGEVTPNPAGEKLREALRREGMSAKELAWVLGFTPEAVELLQAATIIPSTALRLEAALDIPAQRWLPWSAAPEDLWRLSERMAVELTMTRHRRQLLSDRRGSEPDCPCDRT
jgi:plasmid maintenance system antidote protein VapI